MDTSITVAASPRRQYDSVEHSAGWFAGLNRLSLAFSTDGRAVGIKEMPVF